jgi:hypothetical protein
MPELYFSSPLPIRADLAAAHAHAWERIARPGTWWNGAARVAIAAEARQAPLCALCRSRKEALSPLAVEGIHDSLGQLPEPPVEVVHRVRTDPGRLGEGWYRNVIARGLSPEQYVEIVSVVAHIVAVDTMARGLGLDAPALPDPERGAPSRYRPKGAKRGEAWVPWLEPADATDAEMGIYPSDRPPANIMKAMSLVPDEVGSFFDLVSHQYLPGEVMRDFAHEYRAISHAQIELLAARVSALNRCLY